jgi:murein hydrolase activator
LLNNYTAQHQSLPITPIIAKGENMKRGWYFIATMAAIMGIAATLSAQTGDDANVAALRNAKARASAAEQRSETLRQEASSAESAADRVLARRAALGAEIDAANAQIEAARARIAIIADQQRRQAAALGQASAPLLRLNAMLQQMTAQPTALMLLQPGDRRDYVHLRATMAAIEPAIAQRTKALRRQIAAQRDLQAQERVAIGSLQAATRDLGKRRTALAALENDNRDRATMLGADAALEFERAIGQGERARDLVETIDANRDSSENAAALAELDIPPVRGHIDAPAATGAYILPVRGQIASGFGELNPTGYRERGIRLNVAAGARIVAPAAGKITFAGRYRSYGNIIIIDHGGGWTSLVTNIAELGATKGTNVSQGSFIGRAGSDTPEIMIELRRNGRTIDILALIS